LCAVALGIAAVTVSDSRDDSAPRRVDIPGALLVASGVAVLSITVDRGGAWGWGSPPTIGGFILAALLLTAFPILESRVRAPLVDLALFRNVPYVLVTAMAAVSNIGYAATVFLATLYLQLVRGLSPLTAGFVFLAPSLLVALTGPIGARLGKHVRPSVVMAGAGVVSGCGLVGLSLAGSWPTYVVAFAVAGFGLGMGWTFANVATQDAVSPDRAGEASGVLLTIVVTAGGVGVAAVASAIADLQASGSTLHSSIDAALRSLATGVVVAATAMMTIRHQLVRRGLAAPLSMKRDSLQPEADER
jgi:Na+/melibiose symporter-like transporter